MVSNRTEEERILNRVKKKLKLQLERHKHSEWAALIPEILVAMFLICNAFCPVAEKEDLLDYWWICVIIIILSVIIWLFELRKKRRIKSLYTRVDTWTVDMVKTKIVEFRFYDNNSSWKGYDDNNIWYGIITSDGSIKYNWPKYSVRELKLSKYDWREPKYLTIKWKTYHIWDEMIVCVDPNDRTNYIFDMEEMTIR